MSSHHESTDHGHSRQDVTHDKHRDSGHRGPYARLAVMTGLSFIAMYYLMYAMVDSTADVYASVNQAYMAGLMSAPMVLIELALMKSMYRNRRWNVLMAGAAVIAASSCFIAIRRQTAVDDRQFLRSMIPHHSGAILMCEQASISDPDILTLCQGIVSGQQAEIDHMRALLQARGDGGDR